jgi:GDP-D-mannose dehydratase
VNPAQTALTDGELVALQDEFGGTYGDRTVLITGADGFMRSHLTEALVGLGARVHAFVRAISSGALNNIGHLRLQLKVHFADLTDRTLVDYLVRELGGAPDKPYVLHLGAQAHVGESWHRRYETVMANTVGTNNPLQSIVQQGLELEKFGTAGTSEEYGDVYVYRQGENISMADWASLILQVGEERGHWPKREIVTTTDRFRPGAM